LDGYGLASYNSNWGGGYNYEQVINLEGCLHESQFLYEWCNTNSHSVAQTIERVVTFSKKYWMELCAVRQQQDAFDSKGKKPAG
jgi:hypothetical protein